MKLRNFLLLSLLPLLSILTTACHKTCTCIEMNGREHTYTREEVENANGGSCDDMIYMFNQEASGAWLTFYSVCSWD